jgi:hypothetical protein
MCSFFLIYFSDVGLHKPWSRIHSSRTAFAIWLDYNLPKQPYTCTVGQVMALSNGTR